MAKFFYTEHGLLIDAAKDEELTLREARIAASLDLARQVGAVAKALNQPVARKTSLTRANNPSPKAQKQKTNSRRRAGTSKARGS